MATITLITGGQQEIFTEQEVIDLLKKGLISREAAEAKINEILIFENNKFDSNDPRFRSQGELIAVRQAFLAQVPIAGDVGAVSGAGDLPTVGEARLAQEGGPGAPGNIFRQFLSRQPFGALSQAGQDVLGQRFQPAFRSFQLAQGDPLAPENTFRNFLRQEGPFEGQNILDREGFASRLQAVAANIGRPSFSMGEVPTPGGTGQSLNPLTLIEQTILDRLQNNQTALDVSLQPLLGGINPSFRRGVGNIGQRIFDRFQDINPGESFLKFLGQRGGRLFG
jgi:hypothetical protein